MHVITSTLSLFLHRRFFSQDGPDMSNDSFNPFLNPKPFPVTVYVRLSSVYPCVPQELVLRQYTKAFGISDYSPSSLVDALFPADLAQFIPPESCGETVHDSIKKNKSMRRPPLPRENIRNDALQPVPDKQTMSKVGVSSMFSFPRLGTNISCVSQLRTSTEPYPSEDDAQFLVGYDTGTVIVVALKQYGSQLDSMRVAEVKANILGEGTPIENGGGMEAHLWGTSRIPSGVELQGYHNSGKVLCITHDFNVDVGVSGGADGVLYLWDIHNKYGTGQRNIKNQSEVTRSSSAFQFSDTVRNRRLCGHIKDAHDGPISAVKMYTDFLITGGGDKLVHIWKCRLDQMKSPTYIRFQQFQMEGWVRSITAAPLRGVQTDDVLVTDDSGLMRGLKACTAEMQAVFTKTSTSINKDTSVYGVDGKIAFCATRVHHFVGEESMRIGPSRVRYKDEISNTMLRVVPIMNYTALLAVTFSPVVRMMDYAHLKASARIQHPSLTSVGAKVNAKAASSVYKNENDRRKKLFSERNAAEKQGGEKLEPTSSAKLESIRVEPLRFIDALYVPMYDVVLLLDNRNTIFVYERSSNDVLAKVTVSSNNEEGKPKKAVELLPVGRCYNDAASDLSKASSESLLEGQEFIIPFYVLTNKSLELFHVLPIKNTVVEVPAHCAPVIGLAHRRLQERDPRELMTVEQMSENEKKNLFISVSMDGTMICWGRGLHFLRVYKQENTVLHHGVVEKSLATHHVVHDGRFVNDKSEVTSFLFSERWSLAITGHDSGDIRYWGCDGELSEISLRQNFHTNTVSGLAEAYAVQRKEKSNDREELLITVSFDGHLAIWGSPERKSAVLKDRVFVTFNELLCVVFSSSHSVYVTGDSAGFIHFVCAKERVVLRSIPSDGNIPQSSMIPAAYHTGSVTAIALLAEHFVTCDDDGLIFLWNFTDFSKRTPFTLCSPEMTFSDEKHADELNSVVAVSQSKFIVSARSGHVYYFDANVRRYPIGVYKHSCEVCSLVVRQAVQDGFEFLIGGSDGSITLLAESYFQFL